MSPVSSASPEARKPPADDERVPAPVQEPGIARDDGQPIITTGEEGLQGPAEAAWDIQNAGRLEGEDFLRNFIFCTDHHPGFRSWRQGQIEPARAPSVP